MGYTFHNRRVLARGAQLRQRESTDGDLHVAHGQVVKDSGAHKIDGDRNQPGANDVTADFGPARENDYSGDDFDYANGMHECRVLQRENACSNGA